MRQREGIKEASIIIQSRQGLSALIQKIILFFDHESSGLSS